MKAIGLLCNELSDSLAEQIAKYMLLLDIILITIIFCAELNIQRGYNESQVREFSLVHGKS